MVIISSFNIKLSSKQNQYNTCMADSKESYWWDLGSERVTHNFLSNEKIVGSISELGLLSFQTTRMLNPLIFYLSITIGK